MSGSQQTEVPTAAGEAEQPPTAADTPPSAPSPAKTRAAATGPSHDPAPPATASGAPVFVTGRGTQVLVEADRVSLASGEWPVSTALRLGLIRRQD